ncbi:alpha/beta hydrolase [Rhodanobacter umsongensis]|uniref:Alpha/beta hydrolase n=1 Tax=Rhodanobacter umsongensis TaxID=633153 RepID=A0ABW0JJ93_9GAMM
MRQITMGAAGMFIACCAHAQATVKIWPGPTPRTEHSAQHEQVVHGTPVGTVVLGVTTPTLTAYLPERAQATGTSVIIAPGGYCVALAIDAEGNDVARWLQQRGIAAFVLKYRLKEKKQQGIPRNLDMDAACKDGIADAIQAIKLVRQHAAQWNIAPTKVGILGFSAGGMVASGALLQPEAAARPNFAALIYGAPFGAMPTIPSQLPPVFMAWAQDDDVARAPVVKFYDSLMAAGQKPEVHIYSGGGHGFGMRRQGTSSDHWIDDFDGWLAAQGWTKPPARKTKHGERATGRS